MRLTALATLVIAVVMLCAGLALMMLQHRLQTDDVDADLWDQSVEIEQALNDGSMRPVLSPQAPPDAVAQVVFGASGVLASSANMSGQRALNAPKGDVEHRSTSVAISDRPYRLLSRRVGPGVVIHTGVPIDSVERADDALRTGLAFVIPAVTLLFGFLAWWLIGRKAASPLVATEPT